MARLVLLSILLATGLPQGEAVQQRASITMSHAGAETTVPAVAARQAAAGAPGAPAVTASLWNWAIPVQTAQEDLRRAVRLNLPGQAPGALLGGAVLLVMAGLLVGRRSA